MSKINKLHNFKLAKSPDFKTIPVNGVYGGLTVRGQLNMNFYVETLDLPKVIQHQVLDGVMNPTPLKIAQPSDNSSIREVAFGINLDIETAKSVVVWMQEHISRFETSQTK